MIARVRAWVQEGYVQEVAKRRAGRNLNHEIIVPLFELHRLQLVDGGKAGFVLAHPATRAHACPFEFTVELFLASGGDFLFEFQPPLLLLHPRGVVTLERIAATTIKFDKGTEAKYIELQIKDLTAKLQPEFDVKVWQ